MPARMRALKYEILLTGKNNAALTFSTEAETDSGALQFALDLLERHEGYSRAEIHFGVHHLNTVLAPSYAGPMK
jgi:hypothetical protein